MLGKTNLVYLRGLAREEETGGTEGGDEPLDLKP